MAESRPSAESLGRIISHGRGGAGNIGKPRRESFTTPEDLVTPTLKSDHYTTGRGGTGNIAKNDPQHPELARAAQDVEAPVQREPEGVFHYGRGGAANVTKPSEEQRRSREAQREKSPEEGKGLMEKGKEFFGKLGKK
ncbi:hypothetical protein H2199_003263 [Coniosporium tulheliwenetii]|uniref:Uncharacterized protein n=1 Tax=Coniosporium tulheliwenetii TaxID=3383036 RepID=A0ACC2ZDB3_9PEZI|nr:hypothetical protein H2199_003263 [Cladosporium sp. JES 115]